MSTVSFLPLHKRLRELIDKYLEAIEDENLRGYVKRWLVRTASRFYEEFVHSQTILEKEDISYFLAKAAFWKALAHLYRTAGKFTLADKLKYMPPEVSYETRRPTHKSWGGSLLGGFMSRK